MKDKSLKVALLYLKARSFEEKKEMLNDIIEKIKDGVIKDKKDLLDLLKTNELSDRDVVNIIQDQINHGKDFKDYLIYLGEGREGINFIPKTWFIRNVDDNNIRKRLPLKYWDLLRKPEWIEQNKRY